MKTISEQHVVELAQQLVRFITGDEIATATSRPVVGNELTLVLTTTQSGMGRLLGRRGRTFQALQRVIGAAGWCTGVAFKVLIDNPHEREGGLLETSEYTRSDASRTA